MPRKYSYKFPKVKLYKAPKEKPYKAPRVKLYKAPKEKPYKAPRVKQFKFPSIPMGHCVRCGNMQRGYYCGYCAKCWHKISPEEQGKIREEARKRERIALIVLSLVLISMALIGYILVRN